MKEWNSGILSQILKHHRKSWENSRHALTSPSHDSKASQQGTPFLHVFTCRRTWPQVALASYMKMYEASKSCSAFEAGAFSILRFCWIWSMTKVLHFDVIASKREMQKVDFNPIFMLSEHRKLGILKRTVRRPEDVKHSGSGYCLLHIVL